MQNNTVKSMFMLVGMCFLLQKAFSITMVAHPAIVTSPVGIHRWFTFHVSDVDGLQLRFIGLPCMLKNNTKGIHANPPYGLG